ncbi:MAG: lytic transglycosylase domain-containing protein [Bacteroidota bacterium]|nr:lytic transglycosylase domain-containing protein [Bacteroidota bacterium]
MQRPFFIVLGLLSLGLVFIASISNSPFTHSVVVAPTIPNQMTLAGEDVPMNDFGVREALDREFIVNTYRHSGTILYLKKASRWFPVIEPILKEQGIPDDFKYLCVIESGMSQVVSPSGAAGFWQFMMKTAPEYGLEVSKTVDERYHIEKATIAACQYLKESYNLLGSWSLAAASYNMGRNGVIMRLEEQGVTDYWDLHLNSETARYVYRILAVKEVMTNPEKFGFRMKSSDMYNEYSYTKVKVDSTIDDLSEFALQNGSNFHEIKTLNPWLIKKNLLVGEGQSYEIYFPNTVVE